MTDDTIPTFLPDSFICSAIVFVASVLSTFRPMTPLCVLTPDDKDVAVEAESGTKELEFCVVTKPVTGNCVKLKFDVLTSPYTLLPS